MSAPGIIEATPQCEEAVPELSDVWVLLPVRGIRFRATARKTAVLTHVCDLDCRESVTASISESILEYRAMHGRTYHSARHPTTYFAPNDGRQQQSVDLTYVDTQPQNSGLLILQSPLSHRPLGW